MYASYRCFKYIYPAGLFLLHLQIIFYLSRVYLMFCAYSNIISIEHKTRLRRRIYTERFRAIQPESPKHNY